jgi:hypothetical protein
MGGHLACMGMINNWLVGNMKRRDHICGTERRWQENIKADLRDVLNMGWLD